MIPIALTMKLAAFFGSWITRAVIIASIVGGAFVGYKVWRHSIYQEGVLAERAAFKEQIDANQSRDIELSQQARADADTAVRDAGIAGMQDDPFNRDNACTDPTGQQCRAPVSGTPKH